MAITRMNRVIPGRITSQGWKNMAVLPSAIISPQDGRGDGMPSPRNDRVASFRMATATSRVKITMIWLVRFGSTSRTAIWNLLQPMAWAAATKSSSRNRSVAERVTTR